MKRMSELFNINTYIVSQVNPHVIPFIDSDAYAYRDQDRLRKAVVSTGKVLLENTVKYSLGQLKLLGLIPNFALPLCDLFTQNYRGHVTIAPRPLLNDYLNIA